MTGRAIQGRVADENAIHARFCSSCGFVIAPEDGWSQTRNTFKHQDCRDAAYRRGWRDSYANTVRMLKQAERALRSAP